ncbi:MAG: substrate-binding domain-containing protein [Bacillota bacterium]|nr:substrate-binding domain-containing protein [Bacillota bacterium]
MAGKTRYLLLIFASLIIFAVACGEASSPAAEEGTLPPVTIGVLADLSGPLQNFGEQTVRGFKLGLDYATQGTMVVHGHRLKVVVEDDASNPEQAIQKVRKLMEDDGAQFLQGTTSSSAALAIIPEVTKAKIPLLVEVAASNDITGASCSPYVFRTAPNTDQFALASGRYLVREGRQKFLYFGQDYAYGHSSAEAYGRVIESLGGQMDSLFAPLDTVDFTPYLQRILEAKPDALLVGWAGVQAPVLYQQMGDMGVFDKMVVFPNFGDIAQLRGIGEAGQGLLGITLYYYGIPDTPANRWLVKAHEDAYGSPPDLYAAGGMAAAIAMVETLRTAPSWGPEAWAQTLEGLQFETPKGTFILRAEDHQALQPMYVVQLHMDQQLGYPVPRLVKALSPEDTAPPVRCPGFSR